MSVDSVYSNLMETLHCGSHIMTCYFHILNSLLISSIVEHSGYYWQEKLVL